MTTEITKIIVAYWHPATIETERKLGIKHLSEYPYSKKKFNSLVHKIIENGWNIQTNKNDKTIILYIDNKRFRQR